VSSPLAQRAARDDLIARRDRQIKSKDAKSQMSEDTLSEDEADLHRPNGTRCRSMSHRWRRSRPRRRPSASPVARNGPSTCAASSTATSPGTPTAPHRSAASRWCASARPWANGWTWCPPSSLCTATSVASGCASAAI